MELDEEPVSPRSSSAHVREAYRRLFHSGHSLVKLKDAALGGRLFEDLQEPAGVPGRSLAWKIFLIPPGPLQPPEELPPQFQPYLESLRTSRAHFKSLLLEKMRAPDGSYEDGFIAPGTAAPPSRSGHKPNNLERNNPLSLDNENPWNDWFSAVDLRKTILQDVERTFPDVAYFRSAAVQEQLTNILYLHSSMHPTVGYRQGMHELLASLYYAVDFDSLEDPSSDIDEELCELCARRWVAADAWALFDSIMSSAEKWYEWREDQQASPGQLGQLAEPYVAPILQACNRVQRDMLKRVDPALADSLERAGIEPQIYGIRWLRLLFTREFSMSDAMLIWDGLFAVDPSLDLALWICVAMLVRIRNRLIPADYSAQLTYLLRFPTSPVNASTHHTTLLLHQALTLQMSPVPATGAAITMENRNILNIPVEVPDPPPPPVRRSGRPGNAQRRRQTLSNDTPTLEAGPSRQPASLGRAAGTSAGIPEMLARGLYDRGEALGLNRTIYNAVSEIKRNLPDLAANLGVRSPLISPNAYAAYPLVNERLPEERPPWEPRSRVEIERDMAQLQATKRKLGESVNLIVDTLLLDETGDTARAQRVQAKKREALESLAYVRDILISAVPDRDIDEERLFGEEEFRARKQRAENEARERAEAQRERSMRSFQRHEPPPPLPNFNVAAMPPPPPAASSSSALTALRMPSSASLGPRDSRPAQRNPSSVSPAHISKSASQPLERNNSSRPPPTRGSTSTLSTSQGPWNYTRSNFSGESGFGASVASLAPPPRASVSNSSNDSAQGGYPPSGGGDKHRESPVDGSKVGKVQHDPLGVL